MRYLISYCKKLPNWTKNNPYFIIWGFFVVIHTIKGPNYSYHLCKPYFPCWSWIIWDILVVDTNFRLHSLCLTFVSDFNVLAIFFVTWGFKEKKKTYLESKNDLTVLYNKVLGWLRKSLLNSYKLPVNLQ